MYWVIFIWFQMETSWGPSGGRDKPIFRLQVTCEGWWASILIIPGKWIFYVDEWASHSSLLNKYSCKMLLHFWEKAATWGYYVHLTYVYQWLPFWGKCISRQQVIFSILSQWLSRKPSKNNSSVISLRFFACMHSRKKKADSSSFFFCFRIDSKQQSLPEKTDKLSGTTMPIMFGGVGAARVWLLARQLTPLLSKGGKVKSESRHFQDSTVFHRVRQGNL